MAKSGKKVVEFYQIGWYNMGNNDKNTNKNYSNLPPQDKEVKLMATPILSTPVLKGQDLVDLVKDLNKPDKNQSRRKKALATLLLVTK
ncbi:hypothetical protein [Desulforamulus aquiferis]|uniref:Uncharacterized protein n=1 Tax=Desulforamulus aquiferis TaxID=1397668 RepID=A0AAW7Z9P2_9FIRM|nr:hypothetical protein [Desulforamulus aquiferis]MDO7786377.1 hypothetical protein [Desulforamulus aquiferis]